MDIKCKYCNESLNRDNIDYHTLTMTVFTCPYCKMGFAIDGIHYENLPMSPKYIAGTKTVNF